MSSNQGATKSSPAFAGQFCIFVDNSNDDAASASFSECSGLSATTETMEYAEGGLNLYVHKLVVRTRWANVTLRFGVLHGDALINWYTKVVKGQIERRNVGIALYDARGNLYRRWDLNQAYPVSWKGPELNATSSEVAVESIEFAFDGLLAVVTDQPA